MVKFKEKRIVIILDIISLIISLCGIVSIFLLIFSEMFLLGFLLIFCAIPFFVVSSWLSNKDEYTTEFLAYMRKKLDVAKTLDELLEIEKEFISLAIDGKLYCLSFPNDLRKIQQEINNKIDILQKIR